MATRKRVVKKKQASKKSFSLSRMIFILVFFLGSLIIALSIFKFKNENFNDYLTEEERKISQQRIFDVFNSHQDHAFGFDVSEYQSKIDWEATYNIDETHELSFVFIRATAGNDKVDSRFKENWEGAKERQLIRGAYHYYRPNENSIEQADNFIKTVTLTKGDLPPVLDIEKLPQDQSMANLKLGLKRWLDKVEKHYKVKPIIYSGESYHNDFLRKEFSNYHFWIANYNVWVNEIDAKWRFWQFTENGLIEGIKGGVDLNIYNGSVSTLHERCIK